MTVSRALDQFFTRTDVAKQCFANLTAYLDGDDRDWLWIEPSAGGGAFFDLLPWPSIGMDIAPVRDGVLKTNFFDYRPWSDKRPVIVVGNPPFGKNAAIARRFFDHAASFSEVIAFILPRTFQKPNFVNRLNRNMHLIREFELEEDAFEFEGQPYSVPTVFQIWEKRDGLRPLAVASRSHADFSFVKSEEAHFAFQRVGARAGLVSREGLAKSPQSHYFLKAHVDAQSLFERLRSINWDNVKWRTAGNPSIGKGELISNYETAFG